MSLTGTTHHLTAAELEREPRSLGLVAYYDGWTQGQSRPSTTTYPRLLDPGEAASWRNGHADGRRGRATI